MAYEIRRSYGAITRIVYLTKTKTSPQSKVFQKGLSFLSSVGLVDWKNSLCSRIWLIVVWVLGSLDQHPAGLDDGENFSNRPDSQMMSRMRWKLLGKLSSFFLMGWHCNLKIKVVLIAIKILPFVLKWYYKT